MRSAGHPLLLNDLRESLLAHYDRHRRPLPWREGADAYGVWISEVMLQQTRVATALAYYDSWMERFPDVAALAGAAEDEVMRHWAGLGYYARARNLHRAARMVQDRFGGRLPAEPDALRTLPGFGPYTTAAVASIAFGARTAAVDGNVRRVLSRLHDLEAPSAAELERRADALLDPARPGDFNQAMMELGATVCTPRGPRCELCPVARHCLAHARGTVAERPARRRRAPVPERTFALAVVRDPCGRVLLVRRPPEGLLGGLWAFPEARLDGSAGNEQAVEAALAVAAALAPMSPPPTADALHLPPIEHTFTHFRARYLPVLLGRATPGRDGPARRWVDPGAPGVGVPAAQLRILDGMGG